jgi:AcrR family transcriptional regulator
MSKSNMKDEQVSEPKISLKDQIIDAASQLLIEEGYDRLSLRYVAQKAGCSQMAMYRHFANKDALIQYLCVELYTRFTEKMHRRMESSADPREKIHFFISELIGFAIAYPDHYSLIFLLRQSDKILTEERDRLGKEFLQGIRSIIQRLLPVEASREMVDLRLRQIVTCLHGTAALLIAHPRAYGLNREKAIRDTENVVASLVQGNMSVGKPAHRRAS